MFIYYKWESFNQSNLIQTTFYFLRHLAFRFLYHQLVEVPDTEFVIDIEDGWCDFADSFERDAEWDNFIFDRTTIDNFEKFDGSLNRGKSL